MPVVTALGVARPAGDHATGLRVEDVEARVRSRIAGERDGRPRIRARRKDDEAGWFPRLHNEVAGWIEGNSGCLKRALGSALGDPAAVELEDGAQTLGECIACAHTPKREPSFETATSTGSTPANFVLTVTVPSLATTVSTPTTAPVSGPHGPPPGGG